MTPFSFEPETHTERSPLALFSHTQQASFEQQEGGGGSEAGTLSPQGAGWGEAGHLLWAPLLMFF